MGIGNNLLYVLSLQGQAVNPGLLKAEEERGDTLLKERRRPRRGEQTLTSRDGGECDGETELTCPQASLAVF